ncbi:hypothetical protein [Clostridium sp. UBA4548]|uniref:hypothetical protein n=1 Tax=Clostridium sp. UBA4548 TaxID=1946361 RepID=UPI0025BB7008|nr:hypothetical protein [Clostridium sp. UBA4548]
MRAKKKGSALLTVILVFGILVTVGSAVMTVALSDVKLRVTESKRVQNLYGSESGLEETYGVMSKYVDESIEAGNNKVKIYLETLNSEDGILAAERQKVINDEKYNSDYINQDGTVKTQQIKAKINFYFKEGYKEAFTNKIKNVLDNKEGYILGTKESSPRVTIKNLMSEVVFSRLNPTATDPEELRLTLSSAYEKISQDGFKNLRQVESNFKIAIPEYDAPYSLETEKILLADNIIRGKTLVTNSNLQLNNSANLNMQGEVFVLGSGNDSNASSGILINGQNSILNMKNASIISKGDTKILGAASKIIGDENSILFTGNLSIEKSAQSSNMDIKGSVYANNDLVLNGEKSTINIANGFYGVNDIRKISIGDKKKNSSSIIVNAKDIGETGGSSISIGNDLVLLGTAYIDTKPESYQTGESVGVKGNYKAYASALDNGGSYSKGNIIFDYLSPLQLANRFKDGKELTLQDKNNYFMTYYNNKKDTLKLKGINLPKNIYTLGVAINNGSAISGNYTIDNDTIKNSIKTYGAKISEITSVDQYINFSAISSTISKVSEIEGMREIVYLSKDNIDLTISNGSGTDTNNKIFLNGKKAKGIIITSGNVVIDGAVNFEGTIISNGTITVKDNSNVTLNSNKKIVDYLVAKNYDQFTNVFKNDTINASNNIEIDSAAVMESALQNIPKDNLIKTSNWKIVK